MPIHEAEIYRLLERKIAEAGTLTLAATVLGVSPQLLSAVLGQTRALGPKLLKKLGIRRTVKRVVSYELLKAVLAVALVAAPGVVWAQNPVNPGIATFDHVDFAATDAYEVGYFATAAAVDPVQQGTMPKPTSCNPCEGPLPSRPAQFQTWWVAVRAVAGSTRSEWSNRVPFDRRLAVPTVRGLR